MLARCWSGLRTGLAPRSGKLGFHLLRDLGELAQNLDRSFRILCLLEPGPRLLELLEEVLRAPKRVFGTHAAFSLAIRPRMPLTSRPASSEA